MIFLPIFALALGVAAIPSAPPHDDRPIINLGYTKHQAIGYNETGGYYNFSNIRYAEPPVGSHRFKAPVPVKSDGKIHDGKVGRICPQANPAWELTASTFVPAYLKGNASAFYENQTATTPLSPELLEALIPPPDPRETEDCLFLDVVVPKKVYDQKKRGCPGAPVLLWIYGGGYVNGEKNGNGNPAGLIARSETGSSNGVVYVAINYRLGAYGWLGGPSVQADGVANAALLDQRLALKWVHKHIHSFGGDPGKVTVFGESAGGGSIMHQLTAYGGKKPVHFQQAIAQSPGWQPVPSKDQQEKQLQTFLAAAKVKTLTEARALPAENLRLANYECVGLSPYGKFFFGPTVDGTFVPDLPGKLLLEGRYNKRVKLMNGHNANEGLLFASPFIRNDTAFRAYLVGSFPEADSKIIDYIATTLYPPVFDGSFGYKDQIQRTSVFIAEGVFTCNTVYLAHAAGNNSYNYFFSVPPSLHGQDVAYTYYNSPNPMVLSSDVAVELQEYITSFAETGSPNRDGVPHFDFYGSASQIQDLNITGTTVVKDPSANDRCTWWQQALYEGKGDYN